MSDADHRHLPVLASQSAPEQLAPEARPLEPLRTALPAAPEQAHQGARHRGEPLVPGRRPPAEAIATAAVLERDLRPPPGPYRMPPAGRDGVLRRQGAALVRVVHVDDQ